MTTEVSSHTSPEDSHKTPTLLPPPTPPMPPTSPTPPTPPTPPKPLPKGNPGSLNDLMREEFKQELIEVCKTTEELNVIEEIFNRL